MPLLALSVLLSQTPALPKSFDELQTQMRAAQRTRTGIRETWFLVTQVGEASQQMRIERGIDGIRGYMFAQIDGLPVVRLGSDGSKSFFLLYGRSVYAEQSGANPWITRNPNAELPKLVDGDFNFSADGMYDFLISCKPPLQLKGIEADKLEDKPVRVATAEAIRPDTKGRVVVQLFFGEKDFILQRATVGMVPEKGDRVTFRAVRSSLESGVKFEASSFSIPDTRGFQKVEWKALVPGFQG